MRKWNNVAVLRHPLVLALLATVVFTLGAAANDAPGDFARPASDPRVNRALQLLRQPVPVPVVVVSIKDLPPEMRVTAARACAFTTVERTRIYITAHCPTYQQAGRTLWDTIALAALIRHEAAHIEGADEAQARDAEADVFLELSRRGPAEYLTAAVQHAARLRDKR